MEGEWEEEKVIQMFEETMLQFESQGRENHPSGDSHR